MIPAGMIAVGVSRPPSLSGSHPERARSSGGGKDLEYGTGRATGSLRKKQVSPTIAGSTEMHCRNEPSRGTISESREGLARPAHERSMVTSFIKIGLKSKQLAGYVDHLCKVRCNPDFAWEVTVGHCAA